MGIHRDPVSLLLPKRHSCIQGSQSDPQLFPHPSDLLEFLSLWELGSSIPCCSLGIPAALGGWMLPIPRERSGIQFRLPGILIPSRIVAGCGQEGFEAPSHGKLSWKIPGIRSRPC